MSLSWSALGGSGSGTGLWRQATARQLSSRAAHARCQDWVLPWARRLGMPVAGGWPRGFTTRHLVARKPEETQDDDTGRGPAPHQALRASPASPHPVVLKRLRGLPLQARSKAVLGPGALGTGSPVSSSHDTEPRGQHSCKRRSNTRVPSKAHLRPWGRPSPPWGLRGLSTVLTRDMNVVRDPRQAGCCTGRPSEFGGPPAPSQLPTVGGWFTLSLVTPSKTLTCQLPSPLGEVG